MASFPDFPVFLRIAGMPEDEARQAEALTPEHGTPVLSTRLYTIYIQYVYRDSQRGSLAHTFWLKSYYKLMLSCMPTLPPFLAQSQGSFLKCIYPYRMSTH